jgi:hypothetical protein
MNGDRPARVLFMFSRAGFESFFVDGSGAADPATMQRVLAEHEVELVEE